jgi:hypothetical protein
MNGFEKIMGQKKRVEFTSVLKSLKWGDFTFTYVSPLVKT